MENKKKLTIGIDISKKKLDITFVEDPKLKKHLHFIVSNCKEGRQHTKPFGIISPK